MTSRFRRFLSLALLFGLLAATLTPANAAPTPPPAIGKAYVNMGDGTGGFATYPGWNGIYHLYVYDGEGNLLNSPDGQVAIPLAVGSQTFTYFGDYYPYNPVIWHYANQLGLHLNGSTTPSLVVNDSAGPPHPSWSGEVKSATVDGYVVTVTDFSFTERTTINRVAPNSPNPGGYYDSTGSFTIEVQSVLPTAKDQCANGGWQSFGVFKNQGDCVSFVVTKGKNLPAN